METLIVERKDGVAIGSLNRPPVNAVSLHMQLELRETLTEDREVGAVVLCAEGERAFCGGIDLKETSYLEKRQPNWTWS